MRTRIAATCTAVLVVLVGCNSGGGRSTPATPQPADASQASRTIEISTLASLKFDPARVSVKRGETVAFKVVNTDKIDHEFAVGDAVFQGHHEDEMKAMGPDMDMGDDATGFSLKPGESKTIAFAFPTAGTVLYGCHEPGHYPAGMKGEIRVT